MGFFSRIKKAAPAPAEEGGEEGYVELGAEPSMEKAKVVVRPYVIENFEHIKPILDVLREGHTIALINIKPLKDKDIVELKRAINKLKKTCDAIEGDIAGFGEDWIAAVPSFAKIHRGPKEETPAEKKEESPAEAPAGVTEVTEYGADEEKAPQ
ncbi:cell division protein SepF [Candidatus Woesearchaeota archaeon]|nr:cell division protein SepF [Candidatus Woesearchaeota archaeon]